MRAVAFLMFSALLGASELGAATRSPAERFGIEPVSLRPTAGGHLLYFRYRITDAKLATPLFAKKTKPHLVDRATGVSVEMPEDSKLGALRASARTELVAGKIYYVLFGNGAGALKKGSRVDVVIGECKLENIVVE